jgi:hypothetical protein
MSMTHDTVKPHLNAERLLALLGARASTPDVQRLLQQLDLQPDLSRRSSVAVAAPLHGVDLRFCRGHELAESTGLGTEPEQVLACVFFHAQGHEGHQGFAGALPLGLCFSDSRSRARQVLGDPFWSGTRYTSDRWNLQRCYLCLDYPEDEASIQLVTMGLPWRARS